MENTGLTFREQCLKKWAPILEHQSLEPIKDPFRKQITAIMLENQEQAIKEQNRMQRSSLLEAAPVNAMGASSSTAGTGYIDIYDPVLISMVRRAAPYLIAFDVAGVQPMNQPTGLIFAMRSKYSTQGGTEALFNEANTSFSAENASNTFNYDSYQVGDRPDHTANSTNYTVTSGMTTAQMETLGESAANAYNEMAFSIESVSVTARSRALKAEYTTELAQDLKTVHGLDAEAELANILSTEILAEINRELIRKINISATIGAQLNTANAGRFDLDVDSNGRWMVEKFKGLYFQIQREANAIAKATRRGKGNVMICSSDLASALDVIGVLDSSSVGSLNVTDAGATYAGMIGGTIKVYIDPYYSATADTQYFTIGYKGSSPFDAGIFYCPYVPLQMVRAVGENSFQPKIAFKTRYGCVANPFATSAADGVISFANKNIYYRRISVENLM